MVGSGCVFERVEKKYRISRSQRQLLLKAVDCQLCRDRYAHSSISNLYFDTPDYRMVRASIDKPVYKEKLRLRSYGVPGPEDTVFLEIKKKYQSVVYKRREGMTLTDAQRYLSTGEIQSASQIFQEIDWMFHTYPDLRPRVYLSYERDSYCGIQDPSLRVTFDEQLLCRTEDLDLCKGPYGEALLPEDLCILELKCLGAMPLWVADALDCCGIRPGCFSKYGEAYCRYIAPAWRPAAV